MPSSRMICGSVLESRNLETIYNIDDIAKDLSFSLHFDFDKPTLLKVVDVNGEWIFYEIVLKEGKG